MASKFRTFYIDKNHQGVLTEVTTATLREIGLEGGFLTDLELVNFGGNVLQLNIVYQTKYPRSVLAAHPPPGSIIEQGIDFDHASVLLSDTVEPGSYLSGSFSFDSVGLDTTEFFTEAGNNIVQVRLPSVTRSGSGHHTVDVDSASLEYLDGSAIQHSDILAYNIHAQTAPQPGQAQPYTSKLGKLGEVEVQGIRVDKRNIPSDRIDTYLGELGITADRLIQFAAVDIDESLVYVVFAYYKTLEPYLVQTHPYNNSVFIYDSNSSNLTLTFIFLEELDAAYITSTDGLVKHFGTFATATDIAASKVTVDADRKTMRVDVSSVVSSAGVYDFRISGLISADGTLQTRDILYSLQVLQYGKPVGGGGAVFSGSGAPSNLTYITVGDESSSLANSRSLGAGSSKITLVDDGAGSPITVDVVPGNINHDDLGAIDANQHVDHTSVSVTAGVALSGGGDLASSFTIDLNIHEIDTATSVAAGDLFVFHDLTDAAANNITFANLEGSINHGNIAGVLADEHVDHATVSITAGVGLSGGGTIASTRTVDLNINKLTADTIADADELAFHDATEAAANKITFANFEGALEHQKLDGAGSNTHAQLDAHLAASGTNHALSGLGDVDMSLPVTTNAVLVFTALGTWDHDSGATVAHIGDTNSHIDWTADQGATNIHAGNYTDTNTDSLEDLTDTSIASPQAGDVLVYDDGETRWELGSSQNIDFQLDFGTTPGTNQILIYDGDKWTPGDAPTPIGGGAVDTIVPKPGTHGFAGNVGVSGINYISVLSGEGTNVYISGHLHITGETLDLTGAGAKTLAVSGESEFGSHLYPQQSGITNIGNTSRRFNEIWALTGYFGTSSSVIGDELTTKNLTVTGTICCSGVMDTPCINNLKETVDILSGHIDTVSGNASINSGDIAGKANTGDVLEKDNVVVYTPSADYHPATKKYVDDNAGGGGGINEYMYPIWAEENAALGASNTYEWAFGNGASTPSDGGIPVFVPGGWTGHIVAVSLRLGAGTATVEVVHNQTPLGTGAQAVVSAGQQAVDQIPLPVPVGNGDLINFRTVSSSSTAAPCTVCAWIRMTEVS